MDVLTRNGAGVFWPALYSDCRHNTRENPEGQSLPTSVSTLLVFWRGGLNARSHHHVESVHFTTRKGVPFHPALAVIQTPTREYIVLKDNGMQVGCEEDGVANVWMHVLGCDQNGIAVICSK